MLILAVSHYGFFFMHDDSRDSWINAPKKQPINWRITSNQEPMLANTFGIAHVNIISITNPWKPAGSCLISVAIVVGEFIH